MFLFLSTIGPRGKAGGTWKSTVVEVPDGPLHFGILFGEVAKLGSLYWDSQTAYHSHTILPHETVNSAQPGTIYSYAASYSFTNEAGPGFGTIELARSVPITSLERLRNSEMFIMEMNPGNSNVVILTLNPLDTASPEMLDTISANPPEPVE